MFIPDWMVLVGVIVLVACLTMAAVLTVVYWALATIRGVAFASRPEVRRVNREYKATRHLTNSTFERSRTIRAAHWEHGQGVPAHAQAAWRSRLETDADAHWERHPHETTLPAGFVEALVAEYQDHRSV